MSKYIKTNDKMEKGLQDLYDGFLEANDLPALDAGELLADRRITNKPQREFLRAFIATWELVY